MFGIANWRTTLGGVSAILTALGAAAHALSLGDLNAAAMAVPAVLAGIALIGAKDANVTGGTVPQTPEASIRVVHPEVIMSGTQAPTPPPRMRA